MRSTTPTVSLVSSLIAAALVLAPVQGAMAAPEDEATAETPEGETPEGETPEGETPEGEAAEGETPEGETPEGETPEGETPESELTPEEAEAAAAAEAEAAAAAEAEAAAAAEAEAAAAAEAEAAAAAEAEAKEEEPPPPSFIPEEDDGPEEPMIAGKPATGKGLMIAGGVVAGVGLGMTITFSLITRNCTFEGPLQCGLQNQDTFLIPMGAATLLTGTMVLGVGIGYAVRYKRWKRLSGGSKTALVPTTMNRGGGLAWVGRF